jgi:hypothetical protein
MSTWAHERPHTGKIMSNIQSDFSLRFSTTKDDNIVLGEAFPNRLHQGYALVRETINISRNDHIN